jgi:hypothetical protein
MTYSTRTAVRSVLLAGTLGAYAAQIDAYMFSGFGRSPAINGSAAFAGT